MRRLTEAEINEFNRKFEEEKRERDYQRTKKLARRVSVVGTDLEFRSVSECAKYFRVSKSTIEKLLDGYEEGDIRLERIE